MQSLPTPFLPLASWPQWVCWIAVPHPTKAGKFTKFPVNWSTGEVCDAHNKANWTVADIALAMGARWDRGHGAGAGFVFTQEDPFFFLDVDSALAGSDIPRWSDLAHNLCARFAGAAVEVSHSGSGLHIIGQTAPLLHSCRNAALGLELYTAQRFVALTGSHAQGSAGHDCTAALAALAAELFPPGAATGPTADWTEGPVPEWSGPAEDAELVRLASKPSPVALLSGKLTFAALWAGQAPENQRSEADQALANHLAFWTGKDCARIERLMRASGLAREKWDSPSHRDYLRNTILKACAFVTSVATGSAGPTAYASTPEQMAAAAEITGRTVRDPTREHMTAHDQLAHFDGCIYVSCKHQVFDSSRGQLLARPAFDVLYGGHLFIMDPMGQKTTDSAWDAFTQSRVNLPRLVDELCFRPELPLGHVVHEGSWTYANSYIPYHCPEAEGDVRPFLDWLSRVLPNVKDQQILLAYMARIVQSPGLKVQWWPVLQGTRGNGKTILIRILTHIFGLHYSHIPNSHAMAREGMKFNSWIDRRLFVGIEEVSLSKRRDFLDEFKPVVTNDRLPIEFKGVDQGNTDNRANGIMLTNHKDGVPIDVDERRYAVFYTAQQTNEDLIRDKMDGDYFPNLYDWLGGREAYASQRPGLEYLAHWLKRYAIPVALDPKRALHRAPETSSTRAAIMASLGRAEMEIMDAVDEGRQGFAGGWISSYALNNLLAQIRTHVPHAKRRDMLRTLGYDYQQYLYLGRTPRSVLPDGRKVILYLRLGHPAHGLRDNDAIMDAYTKAQAFDATPDTLAGTLLPFAKRP